MAMALRRLSSSIDKPLRPLFNAGSLYYKVSPLSLFFFFSLLLFVTRYKIGLVVEKRSFKDEGKIKKEDIADSNYF